LIGTSYFAYLRKKIFERVVLTPPFRLPAQMPNEACFYYAVQGASFVAFYFIVTFHE